ncbi:MAG TPA: hypothetical protein VLK25_08600, partial [Allosphingosinicella sp.]|nr:hypothetical protein [Allosphingosinicella sp.]
MKPINALAAFAAAITLSIAAGPSVAQGPRNTLPNPVLYMTGQEYYSVNGTSFVRYQFDVLNKDQYPAAMCAAAAGLP